MRCKSVCSCEADIDKTRKKVHSFFMIYCFYVELS